MTALLAPPLSDELRRRARDLDARLRACPFYGRLLQGRLSADEYAAWLTQQYKYVRLTSEITAGLAAATRGHEDPLYRDLHAYASYEHEEEKGHDELLLVDLAALWKVGRTEALGRVERTPTAPAIGAYAAMLDYWLRRQPLAALGVALALETLAALQSDVIYEEMKARSGIPGVERSLRFFRAHRAEVEVEHSSAAAVMLDRLEDPAARSAAFFLANAALAMFEGTAHYLAGLYGRGATDRS
ncbi:MAG: hypothetical protein D6731_00980 [Planctomycetota bacterium]|nr:MAG: hypothetical protein D6731_00980 [Planctomycetota bacterium]